MAIIREDVSGWRDSFTGMSEEIVDVTFKIRITYTKQDDTVITMKMEQMDENGALTLLNVEHY